MALTVVGVQGSMDTLGWNSVGRDMVDAPSRTNGMYVPSGLVASVAAGTRNLLITPGRSLQAATLATLDTSAPDTASGRTIQFPANTSGLPRIDLLTLQVDLRLPAATAASFVIVQGTPRATPTPPKPAQNIRTIWQTPLWQYTVPNGATTATNLVDVRPGNADGLFVQAIISGTWLQDSPAMGVARVGSWIELTGAIKRTGGNIVSGDTATFSGSQVLPDGYLPRRAVVAHGVSGTVVNDIAEHQLIFQTDGTCVLTVIRGTLATNRVVRLDTTVYLGA